MDGSYSDTEVKKRIAEAIARCDAMARSLDVAAEVG